MFYYCTTAFDRQTLVVVSLGGGITFSYARRVLCRAHVPAGDHIYAGRRRIYWRNPASKNKTSGLHVRASRTPSLTQSPFCKLDIKTFMASFSVAFVQGLINTNPSAFCSSSQITAIYSEICARNERSPRGA